MTRKEDGFKSHNTGTVFTALRSLVPLFSFIYLRCMKMTRYKWCFRPIFSQNSLLKSKWQCRSVQKYSNTRKSTAVLKVKRIISTQFENIRKQLYIKYWITVTHVIVNGILMLQLIWTVLFGNLIEYKYFLNKVTLNWNTFHNITWVNVLNYFPPLTIFFFHIYTENLLTHWLQRLLWLGTLTFTFKSLHGLHIVDRLCRRSAEMRCLRAPTHLRG